MRTRTRVGTGALVAGILSLCGCSVVPPPTPVERDFGLSHRLAIEDQKANPDAGTVEAPAPAAPGR